MRSDRDVQEGSLPVIQLLGVRKVYPGPVEVLHGVDLAVSPGELLGIVGPSGSGKSTLLHIMGTLDRPTSGTVLVAGFDVGAMADHDLAALRARHIGFVFQQFFLIGGLSAVDNVAQGLFYAGMPLRERRARAREVLERVGLGHRLEQTPQKLSGGERQRVAIARAVLARPTIVFADEPTGNLDSASEESIMTLIRELHAEGTTIAIITHDRELAAGLPRRVDIRDGQVEHDTACPKATP